jgi:holin-like protein
MLYALAVLLSCQLAGEAFVRAFGLAVPGPVVGMMLLAVLMLVKAPLPSELGGTVDTLLKHLSLLFVPAGVGVIQHFDRLRGEGVRLLAVVLLSTAITLAVTALVFAGVARLMSDDDAGGPGPRRGDDEQETVP